MYYSIEMKSLIRSLIQRMMMRASASTVPAAVVAPVALGRWDIQYDQMIIDRKIIQANEDHCGCCVVPKKEVAVAAAAKNKSSVTAARYEKTEEYLVPYVM